MFAPFQVTTAYNQPKLVYPAVGNYPVTSIPLHILTYNTATMVAKTVPMNPIPDIQTQPVIDQQTLGFGSNEFPKINISGYIQSPMASVVNTDYEFTTLYRRNEALLYGDFIAACMEGTGGWSDNITTVDPSYFQDPFGRQFINPKVTDFTAQYVEGTPGRQNFTIVLLITQGFDL